MKQPILSLLLLVSMSGLATLNAQEERPVTRQFALKYVAASDAFDEAVEALVAFDDAIGKPKEEAFKATKDGGKAINLGACEVESHPRINVLSVRTADGEQVKLVEKLIELVDVKPTVIQISAVMLEVQLNGERKQAIDILTSVEELSIEGKKWKRDEVFSSKSKFSTKERQAAFQVYATALGELDGCSITSRPRLFVKEGDEGVISIGQEVIPLNGAGADQAAEQMTLEVTTTLLGQNQLDMSVSWSEGAEEQMLGTAATIANGGLLVLGGLVKEDGAGQKKERFVLLHPAVIGGPEDLPQ